MFLIPLAFKIPKVELIAQMVSWCLKLKGTSKTFYKVVFIILYSYKQYRRFLLVPHLSQHFVCQWFFFNLNSFVEIEYNAITFTCLKYTTELILFTYRVASIKEKDSILDVSSGSFQTLLLFCLSLPLLYHIWAQHLDST